MRAVPQAAIDFVKAHEGFQLTAYPDSGGIFTIGWGHTDPSLKAGTTITQQQAEAYLTSDLETAALRLAGKVKQPIIDGLTDNQYAALLSFVFNLGTPGTTIWADLNAGHYDQIPSDMMAFVYVHVNGQPVKVQGLVNRRADEVKLWSTQEPGSVDAAPSSAVTRNVSTPAAPADPKPKGIGPAIATAATAAAAAAPQASGAVKAVTDAVSPYADANDHVKAMVSVLALIAAGLAVLTLILIWLRNRAVSRWEPTTSPHLPAGSLGGTNAI